MQYYNLWQFFWYYSVDGKQYSLHNTTTLHCLQFALPWLWINESEITAEKALLAWVLLLNKYRKNALSLLLWRTWPGYLMGR